MQTSPTFLDRLFRVLTVFLALGNLAWFVLTFPIYFRWAYQVGIAGLPVYLLWLFVGLPSLACAVVALRRAAMRGGAGIILKLAFLAILGICALVVLLVSFARWTADTDPNRHFSWITLLATGLVSLGLAFFALRGAGKVVEVKTTPSAGT
ncbi:MAG TPA: hypothetical protein VFF76_08720 [Holophagaceae bacterium]|jgi:hypothetical protein|nr:hypothetical protein [Holophagaceae bacterium]